MRMRALKHLSPTGISLFYKDPDEFYLVYLADARIPRIPQTGPMAVGVERAAYRHRPGLRDSRNPCVGQVDKVELVRIFVEETDPGWREMLQGPHAHVLS